MSSIDTTVATRAGRVNGLAAGELLIWRGVPYARPPIGELRHRAPEPVEAWSGVRDATDAPSRAWQSDADASVFGVAAEQPGCDEDCLYLNVTAPAEPMAPADGRGYPVLVWLHGGGYLRGSGSGGAVRDGAVLARAGIVVVTVNYRLGAFGFLALDDVLGAGEADSGAAGLLDQIAALAWVRDNISAFGGDPGRVTVYGISAGAKSVANVLGSPLAAGLVTRAISGSGGGEHVATPQQAAQLRRRVFRELGLADADAEKVRSIPAEELLAAQDAIAMGAPGTWVWRPGLGGRALPVRPIDAIAAGSARGVALLAGNNGNEGASYQLLDGTTAEQAPRVLRELFGADAATEMLAGYARVRPELDETGRFIAVMGDERYGVPTQRLAQAQVGHGPVWRYRLDSSPPGVPAVLAGGHGLDTAMIWGSDLTAGVADPRARLGESMVDSWSRFIHGGAPAGGLLSPWAEYTAEQQQTMIIDAAPHLEAKPRSAELALWDGRSWPSGTWWQIEGVS